MLNECQLWMQVHYWQLDEFHLQNGLQLVLLGILCLLQNILTENDNFSTLYSRYSTAIYSWESSVLHIYSVEIQVENITRYSTCRCTAKILKKGLRPSFARNTRPILWVSYFGSTPIFPAYIWSWELWSVYKYITKQFLFNNATDHLHPL